MSFRNELGEKCSQARGDARGFRRNHEELDDLLNDRVEADFYNSSHMLSRVLLPGLSNGTPDEQASEFELELSRFVRERENYF